MVAQAERREQIKTWLGNPSFEEPPPQPKQPQAAGRRKDPTQAARVRRAWLRADADGSGSLDKEEFAAMLAAIGQDGMDVGAVFAQIDTDNSGSVEYGEFVSGPEGPFSLPFVALPRWQVCCRSVL